MKIERQSSSIFHVDENTAGTYDVIFDVPPAATEQPSERVRFALVSDDRHAADTMADMFNRVVTGVSRTTT